MARKGVLSPGRRKLSRILAGSLVAVPLLVPRLTRALQPAYPIRIGLLRFADSASSEQYLEAFRQGLREHGYVEGENLVLERRYADGKVERLPTLAQELVKLNVRVIVTTDTPATLAARQATTKIPIVFATAADPVGTGLVSSLAHPGGNVTGSSNLTSDIGSKYVELLTALVNKLALVAVLVNPANPSYQSILKSVQTGCDRAGIKSLPLEADTPAKIDIAFTAMAQNHAGAIIVALDPFFSQQRRQIGMLAMKYRLPAIGSNEDFVDADTPILISYGQNIAEHWRHAAAYCDKILKGEKPGDLPVEQSETLRLVVNLKVAKELGITVPYAILIRADKVIE